MADEAQIMAEMGVLGWIIEHPGFLAQVEPEWFSDVRCMTVACQLKAMAIDGLSIGKLTLMRRLLERGKAQEIGGAPFIDEITQHSVVEPKFDSDLEAVVEARCKVLLGRVAAVLMDPSKTSRQMLAEVRKIEQQLPQVKVDISVGAIINELIDELEAALNNHGEPSGLKSGFKCLDLSLDGLKPGALIVIAGRPSSGKSAFALNICCHLTVMLGISCGFISMEMSKRELVDRLWTQVSGVPKKRFSHATATQYDFMARTAAADKIRKAPLHIEDRCQPELSAVLSTAHNLHTKKAIRLLVIDYLGLMYVDGVKKENRATELGIITRAVKHLSKELAIPVVLLAQLNRESVREERTPKISDLRDSGAIEQDADAVLLIHMPNETTRDVIVGKNRAGPQGHAIKMNFDGPLTLFTEAHEQPSV